MAIQIDGTNGVSGGDGSAAKPALRGSDTNTGISFGADTVNFVTGGSTRATVTSSGRLGIGTTSPSFRLHSYDTSAAQGFFNGWSAYSTYDSSGAIRLGNQTSYQGRIDYDGGTTNFIFENSYSSGIISWKINGTERMRISGGAVVMSSDTTFTQESSAVLTVRNTATYTIACKRTGTGGEGQIAFKNANGVVGSISTSGSSTTYSTSSDYRLKENVVPVADGITRLQQLNPSRFNFIADPDTTVDGFIAHEVQTVVPEAITGAKDEVEVWKEGEELPDGVSVGDNKLDEDGNTIPVYQGIDQSKLVPVLTAALQEAIGKIEALETRVAQLEGGAA